MPRIPEIHYDSHDPVLIGLQIGNAIYKAVYETPIPDLVIPTPLPCSPCLHPKEKLGAPPID